jgi:hypothetical protein
MRQRAVRLDARRRRARRSQQIKRPAIEQEIDVEAEQRVIGVPGLQRIGDVGLAGRGVLFGPSSALTNRCRRIRSDCAFTYPYP